MSNEAAQSKLRYWLNEFAVYTEHKPPNGLPGEVRYFFADTGKGIGQSLMSQLFTVIAETDLSFAMLPGRWAGSFKSAVFLDGDLVLGGFVEPSEDIDGFMAYLFDVPELRTGFQDSSGGVLASSLSDVDEQATRVKEATAVLMNLPALRSGKLPARQYPGPQRLYPTAEQQSTMISQPPWAALVSIGVAISAYASLVMLTIGAIWANSKR